MPWLGVPAVAAIPVSQKGGQRYLDENGLRSGSPTVGSALLRILYAIPSLIVLAILVFIAAIAWVIAVVFVLLNESHPYRLSRFLLGIVRWEACLLAYLASLVDRYPRFTLETGSVSPVAASSQG